MLRLEVEADPDGRILTHQRHHRTTSSIASSIGARASSRAPSPCNSIYCSSTSKSTTPESGEQLKMLMSIDHTGDEKGNDQDVLLHQHMEDKRFEVRVHLSHDDCARIELTNVWVSPIL